MKERRNNNKYNWLIILIIIVVVTVVGIVNPANTVRPFVEENYLVLEGYEEIRYQIPLESIQQVTFTEEPVYPADARGVMCGTYTNEVWGEHVLYANTKIDACIVLESTNGTYVFNVESAKTTKAFCEALVKIL